MATDACYADSTEWVCTLSARGQKVLVWTPWMWMLAGVTTTITGAVVSHYIAGWA